MACSSLACMPLSGATCASRPARVFERGRVVGRAVLAGAAAPAARHKASHSALSCRAVSHRRLRRRPGWPGRRAAPPRNAPAWHTPPGAASAAAVRPPPAPGSPLLFGAQGHARAGSSAWMRLSSSAMRAAKASKRAGSSLCAWANAVLALAGRVDLRCRWPAGALPAWCTRCGYCCASSQVSTPSASRRRSLACQPAGCRPAAIASAARGAGQARQQLALRWRRRRRRRRRRRWPAPVRRPAHRGAGAAAASSVSCGVLARTCGRRSAKALRRLPSMSPKTPRLVGPALQVARQELQVAVVLEGFLELMLRQQRRQVSGMRQRGQRRADVPEPAHLAARVAFEQAGQQRAGADRRNRAVERLRSRRRMPRSPGCSAPAPGRGHPARHRRRARRCALPARPRRCGSRCASSVHGTSACFGFFSSAAAQP